MKYKNLAEVNGRLTYVLTAEEIDNAPTVSDRYNEGYAQGYEKGYNQAKVNVRRGIMKQFSKHNILIPEWLEI